MSEEQLRAIRPVDDAVDFRVVYFDRVQPDLEYGRKAVGLQPALPAHQRWLDLVDELAATLPRVMRPRVVYRIDRIRRLEARRLELDSDAVFNGAIGKFLAHAELIATFVITIGSGVERLARKWLRDGKIMGGTIADALASEAAEATANRAQEEIRAWALQRGYETTPRYSPGYCGMLVRQQRVVFASLPARAINVQLTPSCLMVPVKSVSGLIGLGPADKVHPQGYPCEFCDHPHCMQRRVAFNADTGAQHDWAVDEPT
jgi:hypothetical protein